MLAQRYKFQKFFVYCFEDNVFKAKQRKASPCRPAGDVWQCKDSKAQRALDEKPTICQKKYSPAPAQRIVGHMLAKPIQLNSSAVKNILYNTYYLLPTLHQEELQCLRWKWYYRLQPNQQEDNWANNCQILKHCITWSYRCRPNKIWHLADIGMLGNLVLCLPSLHIFCVYLACMYCVFLSCLYMQHLSPLSIVMTMRDWRKSVCLLD